MSKNIRAFFFFCGVKCEFLSYKNISGSETWFKGKLHVRRKEVAAHYKYQLLHFEMSAEISSVFIVILFCIFRTLHSFAVTVLKASIRLQHF